MWENIEDECNLVPGRHTGYFTPPSFHYYVRNVPIHISVNSKVEPKNLTRETPFGRRYSRVSFETPLQVYFSLTPDDVVGHK